MDPRFRNEWLLAIPPELTREILTLTDDSSNYESIATTSRIAKLAKVCTGYNNFFKPELEKRKLPRIQQLLIAVLQGNIKEISYFVKNHPDFFFIKIEERTKDYAMDLVGNCRTIQHWSAYQAIFGTGSKNILWDEKNNSPTEIKHLLDKYLNTLPNGHQLADEQEQEKFPNGFAYPESTYDFMPLASAISDDHQLRDTAMPNRITLESLEAFRIAFKPDVVTIGYHFNLKDFVRALTIYNENRREWHRNQQSFYGVYVIGFLGRLLPAAIMQNFCHRIKDNSYQYPTQNYEVFNYLTRKKAPIYPLATSGYLLGVDFFIDPYVGIARGMGWGISTQSLNYLITMVNSHERIFASCSHQARPKLKTSPLRIE